jgi:hypothetical protein
MNKNLSFTEIELESIKDSLYGIVSERFSMGDSASESDEHIISLIDSLDIKQENVYADYIEILLEDILQDGIQDGDFESWSDLLDPKSLFEWDGESDEADFIKLIKNEYGYKYD